MGPEHLRRSGVRQAVLSLAVWTRYGLSACRRSCRLLPGPLPVKMAFEKSQSPEGVQGTQEVSQVGNPRKRYVVLSNVVWLTYGPRTHLMWWQPTRGEQGRGRLSVEARAKHQEEIEGKDDERVLCSDGTRP